MYYQWPGRRAWIRDFSLCSLKGMKQGLLIVLPEGHESGTSHCAPWQAASGRDFSLCSLKDMNQGLLIVFSEGHETEIIMPWVQKWTKVSPRWQYWSVSGMLNVKTTKNNNTIPSVSVLAKTIPGFSFLAIFICVWNVVRILSQDMNKTSLLVNDMILTFPTPS